MPGSGPANGGVAWSEALIGRAGCAGPAAGGQATILRKGVGRVGNRLQGSHAWERFEFALGGHGPAGRPGRRWLGRRRALARGQKPSPCCPGCEIVPPSLPTKADRPRRTGPYTVYTVILCVNRAFPKSSWLGGGGGGGEER